MPTVLDNLPANYTAIFKNRYSLTNYKGGGIATIFHERYAEHCDVVKSNNEHVLWCHIRRTAHGGTKDILLGSVYIPPENSEYYDPKLFEDLELEVTSQGVNDLSICLRGGINARTSEICDYISEDDNPLDHGNNEIFDFGIKSLPPRKNKDKKNE